MCAGLRSISTMVVMAISREFRQVAPPGITIRDDCLASTVPIGGSVPSPPAKTSETAASVRFCTMIVEGAKGVAEGVEGGSGTIAPVGRTDGLTDGRVDDASEGAAQMVPTLSA